MTRKEMRMMGATSLAKMGKTLVPARSLRRALLNLSDELRAAKIARRGRAKLLALAPKNNLKLHLGCGPDLREGWVNVDLFLGRSARGTTDRPTFINYDLRRGLPMAPKTCELIYSSHFFEHLEMDEGTKLMEDC